MNNIDFLGGFLYGVIITAIGYRWRIKILKERIEMHEKEASQLRREKKIRELQQECIFCGESGFHSPYCSQLHK